MKIFTSSSLLFISLLGLCLIAILTFSSPVTAASYPWRKPLVGSIFGLICILGTLSALFPRRCSHLFRPKTRRRREDSTEIEHASLSERNIELRGHHPGCRDFSAHVLLIGGRTLCAGCAGLALGAVVSLLGTFLYFFVDLPLADIRLFLFLAGFTGVACGLLQYHLFGFENGFIHMFLNFIFVLGAFLLLVAADAMTDSLSITIYILALVVFWIYTRIELSNWNHRMICGDCEAETCPYYVRRSL